MPGGGAGRRGSVSPDPLFVREHPLEGDGVLLPFYHHLWKKTKGYQGCPEVRCPDTVVYERNFPRGWFTYDPRARELRKRQGRELDAAAILAAFSPPTTAPPCEVVASYLSVERGGIADEAVTAVEFFTRADLEAFLLGGRPERADGVLQRFVPPKGPYNAVVQAAWSPRVCIVRRKTSRCALADPRRTAYERAVTFEGPSHHTEEGVCPAGVTQRVREACDRVRLHFQSTERRSISRMVLYFKVDREDALWLLWCGSLRISDRHRGTSVPLNLAPVFTAAAPRPNDDDPIEQVYNGGQLWRLDQHQSALSRDAVFRRTVCRSPSPTAAASSPRRSPPHGGRSPRSPVGGRPPPPPPPPPEWYAGDERAHSQYRQLRLEQELVTSVVGDVLYEAYSHFQQPGAGPFPFALPAAFPSLLGPDAFRDLLRGLRAEPRPARTAAGGAPSKSGALEFVIPATHRRVVSGLEAEAQTVLAAVFGAREAALRLAAEARDTGGGGGTASGRPFG